MGDLKSTKGSHLTQDERQDIMECLDKGMTFKAIARRIGKAQTTVSREVKKRLSIQPLAIKKTKGDGTPIEGPCPLLLKAPFVCNACKKRRGVCVSKTVIHRKICTYRV